MVFSDVSVSLTKTISTVAVVTFSAEGGSGDGWVRFGRDGDTTGLEVAADPQEDGSWRAVLVGVPPETAAWLQVGRGGTLDSTVHTYTTGAAPDWLTTTLTGTPTATGFVLTSALGAGGSSSAVILTPAGEPVWWKTLPADIRGILTRVRMDPDQRSVWFNAFSIEPVSANRDTGNLIRVSLDGESLDIFDAHKTTHHDFFIREDGTFVLPRLDDRQYGGKTVRGDALVEIDLETGAETVLWSSWDDLTPSTQGHPDGWWTMLNHVIWDEATDDYVFSMKNISTVARLDRATGELEWVLGGSNATLSADMLPIEQHGLDIGSDGDTYVFDNQGSGSFSRVIRYEVDTAAKTAEAVWSYEGDVTAFVMGDVQELPSGNVWIHWSTARRLEEVSPAGEVVARIDLPDLNGVGYITWADQIGPAPAR